MFCMWEDAGRGEFLTSIKTPLNVIFIEKLWKIVSIKAQEYDYKLGLRLKFRIRIKIWQ